jgi:DnaJ-class molecular chaperone
MGTVLTVAAVLAVCYYISLRIWPHRRCRRCTGSGRNFGSSASRFGLCKRCGGSGREVRLAARIIDQHKR